MRQCSSKDLITLKDVNADTTLLSTMQQRSSKESNHSEKMSMLTLLYCQPCGNVLVKDIITLKNVNADTNLLSTMWQRSSNRSNHSEKCQCWHNSTVNHAATY